MSFLFLGPTGFTKRNKTKRKIGTPKLQANLQAKPSRRISAPYLHAVSVRRSDKNPTKTQGNRTLNSRPNTVRSIAHNPKYCSQNWATRNAAPHQTRRATSKCNAPCFHAVRFFSPRSIMLIFFICFDLFFCKTMGRATHEKTRQNKRFGGFYKVARQAAPVLIAARVVSRPGHHKGSLCLFCHAKQWRNSAGRRAQWI